MPRGKIVALVMAGGAGQRFWPLSVVDRPKQFLKIIGSGSMLQASWRRLDSLVPPERRMVITAGRLATQTRADLPDLLEENLIGEPLRRDTATAAILGAAVSEHRWPGAVVVTVTADHVIEPAGAFRRVIREATRLADAKGLLCTIGIVPHYPAEGYGYIRCGSSLDIGGGLKAFRVSQFTEKPRKAAAIEYLRSGHYYWNSGLFIWQARALLDEARRHLPAHHAALTAAAAAWGSRRWKARLKEAYASVERLSVDHGIMEHTRRAAVVEAAFNWTDLGGWVALGDLLASDKADNSIRGRAVVRDCRNVVVYNDGHSGPVVCIGLENTVVAHTDHGVLVCPKDKAEQIKKAVEELYEDRRPDSGR